MSIAERWIHSDAGSRRGRRHALACVMVVAVGVLLGCERSDPTDAAPLRTRIMFGELGRAHGQFVYPRAIDNDGSTLWIIDKSGRVHHMSRTGERLGGWIMPAHQKGKPVGLTCGPDGLIYIADTHEYRVAVFDPDGEMVDSWGAYGDGPGEFRYVTDVAIRTADDGSIERFYVSEYGGNDRVSVFDANHEYLFSFGSHGSGSRADDFGFSRPQSIVWDEKRDELYVADAANHRIGRFSGEGELLGWMGSRDGFAGAEPGRFGYPYGLAMRDDGTLLVSEFGMNRVQRIDPETGDSLGCYGVSGRNDGELAFPWGVTQLGGMTYVLDSGNHRVQGFRIGGEGLLPW